MPIQAFIDDSGVKGTDRVFVFAGQFAQAYMWAEFSDAWAAQLRQAPGIPAFHMHDAVRLKGAFAGWREDDRDEKLYRLARVVARYGFEAIHCSTNLQKFERISVGLPRPFRDPYFFPFHLIILGICSDLESSGHSSECEIIFDEHRIFGPRVLQWYPVVRALLGSKDAAFGRLLPAQPLFRTDTSHVPLQAADMLAWCYRRHAAGGIYGDRFSWLLKTLFTVPVSKFSTTLDGDRWHAAFEDAYKPSVVDEITRHYDQMFGGCS